MRVRSSPRRLAYEISAVVGALIALTWIWDIAIDGDWGEQGSVTVGIVDAPLVVILVSALLALGLAIRSRSWVSALVTALLVAFSAAYVFASVFAIGLSRSTDWSF